MIADAHVSSYAVHFADVDHHADRLPSVLGAPNSLDAQRHWRMYEMVRPLVANDPEASWLTIGDTGADAHALQQYGAVNITASSISDSQIRHLQTIGYLSGIDVRSINAESIPDLDPRPDYILCKEAYHHFPRPDLAFYQFIQKARKAVVLIEPADGAGSRPLDLVRRLAKRALRGDTEAHFHFEETGNFIFRLSLREIEKKLTALQGPAYFYRYFNNFFSWPLCGRATDDHWAAATYRAGLATQDLCARMGLMGWGLVAVVIPTVGASHQLASSLRASGFAQRSILRNPFLAAP